MAANKRTAAQRQRDLATIARLVCRGVPQAEIAGQLGVSQPQVSYDLKEVFALWKAQAVAHEDERRLLEVERLLHVERTAWDAWERSCQPKKVAATEKGSGPQGERKKTSARQEGRDGNPRFLQVVLQAIKQRCELLSLIKEQQEVTGPHGGPQQHVVLYLPDNGRGDPAPAGTPGVPAEHAR